MRDARTEACRRCPDAVCRAGECFCTKDGASTVAHVANDYCPVKRFGTGEPRPTWEPPKNVARWKLDSHGSAGCGCA